MTPVSNLLLETLPAQERAVLNPLLLAVPLPLATPLHHAGRIPEYLYLMTSGIASSVTPMEDGVAVEVAINGREGLTGGVHLLGQKESVTDCFIQVPGTAMRVELARFQAMLEQLPVLQGRVLQHMQFEAFCLQQLSACNRVHLAEERLARWLLMVADRTGSLELPLTQDFMAEMLGTRRTTITLVAGTLQRSGLIEYRRGTVRILDRDRLQQTACECYRVVFRLHQQLYQTPAISMSSPG